MKRLTIMVLVLRYKFLHKILRFVLKILRIHKIVTELSVTTLFLIIPQARHVLEHEFQGLLTMADRGVEMSEPS